MPKISDAELLTLAVLQALLGFTSETRFLRHAAVHLRAWFPYIPHQSGYNKRLRKAQGQLRAIIRMLAADTEHWDDDTWVMDSTPVECGRSRPTALRSDLAGWASYGYCASHSRWFWGLRLHLVCTPAGLPITFALANPKIDEREVAGTSSKPSPRCCVPASGSSPTRAIAPTSSSPSWPTTASSSSDPPTRTTAAARPARSSSPCASSSNRSTPRSRPSSTSNVTVAEPQVA